jgi:hypothetical protein
VQVDLSDFLVSVRRLPGSILHLPLDDVLATRQHTGGSWGSFFVDFRSSHTTSILLGLSLVYHGILGDFVKTKFINSEENLGEFAVGGFRGTLTNALLSI